ncbi:MAG: RsmE family RNA methyltransferase [Candidatus Paceibacterota bacterium]|jgi:16S rRNA (uracil1498-N3)-methyltransferase
MRLHRFYYRELIGNRSEITINSLEITKQIRRVFRLKTGDLVIIFDGSGFDYVCKINNFTEDTMKLSINEKNSSRYIPEKDIVLCVAIVKKDTFEWIVEKATELGVTNIIPIISERSEKKSLNIERLKKISIEASEQSGRGRVPIIEPIVSLIEAINTYKDQYGGQTSVYAFHTEGDTIPRSDLGNDRKIVIFIGPEGGWSPSEIDMFHKDKISIHCLGKQILRTETAVIAVLSRFVF